MPLKDQISAPLTPAEMTALNTALDNAVTTLTPKAVNLTAERFTTHNGIDFKVTVEAALIEVG